MVAAKTIDIACEQCGEKVGHLDPALLVCVDSHAKGAKPCKGDLKHRHPVRPGTTAHLIRCDAHWTAYLERTKKR